MNQFSLYLLLLVSKKLEKDLVRENHLTIEAKVSIHNCNADLINQACPLLFLSELSD